jgi:hypothetical protein
MGKGIEALRPLDRAHSLWRDWLQFMGHPRLERVHQIRYTLPGRKYHCVFDLDAQHPHLHRVTEPFAECHW